MDKKYKVILNQNYYMIPENMKESFENKLSKELVLCNKTGNVIFKSVKKVDGILSEYQVLFECGKEYDAIEFNENGVYHVFQDQNENSKTDNYNAGGNFPFKNVLKLPKDSPLIGEAREVNYIPEKYKLFDDGCLVVCIDDNVTKGKDEILEKNKLYQLNDIKFNKQTGKTTAQVVGSKYRWCIDRFVLINNFDNLPKEQIMEKIRLNHNKNNKSVNDRNRRSDMILREFMSLKHKIPEERKIFQRDLYNLLQSSIYRI